MGLDTTHGCWHASYGTFAAFRAALAKATGYDPEASPDDHPSYKLPDGDYQPRNFEGWWDEDPENILDVFFVHSDCDGYIFPKHAEKLADALEQARDALDPDWHWALDNWVNGLRAAWDEGEVIDFH
jgi:hypothetical protein